ncbi:hypothetical protein VVD49_12020 [Uliginosibacterium sp. H3]|uniref:YtxH domain-containing protein n=1 Tax=Uliginosibacterium silvisoli TaxID=3114758 RepID=A0ABU6K3I2_9RHOO|nr:hypothetical protein [Uliginosibacterium sp. H3]
MKFSYLLMIGASVFALAACEKQTTGEKITDKVGDAMDNRPHEKAKDAAEDIGDAAKDAGSAIKEEAGELKDKAKDATN